MGAFFCSVGIGMVSEIKSLKTEFVSCHLGFTGWIKLFQYPAVFAEDVIYVSDVIGFFGSCSVVVGHPALVRTELFVCSAGDLAATLNAKFLLYLGHFG